MEGILKVTPEKLIQSSGEFADMGGQMKNLTGEMNLAGRSCFCLQRKV